FRSLFLLDRSRFRSRFVGSRLGSGDGLASVAAEVQADTHASHPLGVFGVQAVQHVNTAADQEVLGEVVLQTGTHDGEGGLVMTASVGVVQLLVTEATGDVRTQALGARSTEVVNGFQSAQVTVDVFLAGSARERIVGLDALVNTVG